MKQNTKPFLRQVAEHYLDTGFGGRIFIFPNRRSMAFFRMYISDILKERGGQPVIAPEMMGVSDFFSRMTGRRKSDRTRLLFELYDCYKAVNAGSETLDEFIYWGDALISDFDDIDKYRIDAAQLFRNILDLKAMTDDMSYLSEEQAEAIRKLSAHFEEDRWKRVTGDGIDVKERFLKLWTRMHELYKLYRKTLAEKGLAYEGMIYRDLADQMKEDGAAAMLSAMAPEATGCVFIGLNTLNTCEKQVLRSLKSAGLAEFCWDFSGDMIRDRQNQASTFLSENIGEFPNRFDFDVEGLGKPNIHVVSVPSATGQAKVLHNIMGRIPEEERGLDTAVVLPDETMLMPVLSSLPKDGTVNITMGYPLASSEWNTFMRSVIALQMHLRDGRYFYHRQVKDIFSSGIAKSVWGEEGEACAQRVQQAAKSYIPVADLQGGDVFKTIFRPVVTRMDVSDKDQTRAFADYLIEVIEAVAHKLDKDSDALHLECAYRYLQCMRRLSDLGRGLKPKSFAYLVEQLVSGVSVPFSGEPLGGLQVMGPLETRALDFRHMVILNANEGVFPGRNSRSSFIPPELRKAFGLPTYELQDSVWAYYFYRMISRATDVWMVYDSRTEGLSTGEESRYIKQLEYLYPDKCSISRETAVSSIQSQEEEEGIAKTAEDVEVIRNTTFSASSIHKYISCPAQFYYYVVKKLYPQDEVSEDLDKGMLGTICHDTLQAIYCCEEAMSDDYFFDKREEDDIRNRKVGVVTEEFINGWLSRKKDIRRKVNALICHQLHCPAVEGRDLVAAEIAVKYITGVLESDIKLIRKHGNMKIIGLEKKYYGEIQGHRFKGFVDRMDEFEDGTLRIVDYKTGSDKQCVIDPADGAAAIADKVFNKDAHKFKAAFQFFVYDRLAARDSDVNGRRLSNSMYSMSEVFTDETEIYPVDNTVLDAIDQNLGVLFKEMEDTEVGFERKGSGNTCKYCDYAAICGKLGEKQ